MTIDLDILMTPDKVKTGKPVTALNFTGKISKQGNALIINIPKALHLSTDDLLNTKLKIIIEVSEN